MSILGLYCRLPAGFRYFLPVLLIVLVVQFSLRAVGFGDWVERTPVANTIYRLFAILLFGGLGALALWGRRHDPEMRSTGYLVTGLLFLGMAAVHAILLLTGPASVSSIVSAA